jgi:hypothetical protein
VYAQEAGKPAVFLTSDSLLRSAQRGASDFRDRTVLAFERKDVKAIEIQGSAGLVVAVELKGPESWELTKPLGAPGDAREIGGLLDKLRAAKVKEFPPAPARGPAEYGLDRPLRVTLWVGEDKERSAKTLRFGKAVPEKKAVYAQREGDTAVLLVEEELLKAVPTSPTGFRDKTVLAYDRSKLERFELESPKGKVAAALEGGAWRITAPEPLKGDEAVVNELLGKARDLRATDFVAEEATRLAAFGLDRPQVRLTLWEKDAKEPKTLRLGPAKEPGRAYATAGGTVVTVDGAALTQLARSVQDLRDRTVLPAFETRDVSRVEIRRGEVVLTMERKGESEWQLVVPKPGKVRPGRVDELVWSLRNLRWKTLVAERGWDAGRYGLGPPSTTVTLGGKDGKTLAALALGRREQEELFVRVPGQPALYAVESDSVEEIPTAPEDWLL